ncbi:YadA C-terminal domain-containing protein [Citrobacter freundii]|uniref:YadA C-terminal domain-containing protein n=1 Tax=Citrobacter freundii TaxID=546 RepID=UPI001900C19A|nr:YadA C-terminal domain-containing protein [Citrobacter freundii]MBJ8767525.1 YadA C-terminal domain-containing protein [Citrobacter freundii]
MKAVKTVIAVIVAVSSMSANAYDSSITMTPYDQQQDIATSEVKKTADDAREQAKVAVDASTRAHNTAWAAQTAAAQADAMAQNAYHQANYVEEIASANTEHLEVVDSRLSNTEKQISGMNAKFAGLNKQINDVEKKASKGVAGVAAMSNIPALTGNGNFSFGMGVGNFNSETSIAAGFQARATKNVVTKVSFASDGDENVFGAGASFEW